TRLGDRHSAGRRLTPSVRAPSRIAECSSTVPPGRPVVRNSSPAEQRSHDRRASCASALGRDRLPQPLGASSGTSNGTTAVLAGFQYAQRIRRQSVLHGCNRFPSLSLLSPIADQDSPLLALCVRSSQQLKRVLEVTLHLRFIQTSLRSNLPTRHPVNVAQHH